MNNIFRPDTQIPWNWADNDQQLKWIHADVHVKDEVQSFGRCLVFGTVAEKPMYNFGYSPCKTKQRNTVINC